MDEGSNLLLQIIFLTFLIFTNAFFAASEIAIISLNDNKIKKMADEGNKRAKYIVKFTKEPSKFFATIQVGVTISGLLASAVAAESFAGRVTNILISWGLNIISQDMLRAIILIVITVILSYFTLVFGELVPKRLAMQNPEFFSMASIGLLNFVGKIARPFVNLLTLSTNIIIKIFGADPNANADNVTEEEIRMMVDLGEEKGTIECTEKEMIENVFDFNNTTVSEAMTHRKDIVAIAKDATLEDIIDMVEKEKFTRFPVYEEDIDNIIGMIHAKDLIRYITNKEKKPFDIKDILRQIYFVPESKKTDDTFRELQKNKIYMAVVIDEYGGTAGIVSVEDLMEEIVGNIFDEYDNEEENEFEVIDENTQIVAGTVSLFAIARRFDKKLPVEDYDTLGGFIMGHLGIVPEDNERPEFEFNGLLFKVEAVEEKRITKVKICDTGEEADTEEKDNKD
jgi:putative hemolysin